MQENLQQNIIAKTKICSENITVHCVVVFMSQQSFNAHEMKTIRISHHSFYGRCTTYLHVFSTAVNINVGFVTPINHFLNHEKKPTKTTLLSFPSFIMETMYV